MSAIILSPVQSVIIPTYNRKEMLAEAIESVLNQRNVEFEVIVIDDCSTDGTEEFVRGIHDERIRYFRNEKNSGQDYSRMIGFREARGKYITFLDDDDYYTDYDFFSKAVNIFCEHKDDEIPVVMVCANAEVLNISTNESRYSDIGKPGRVKGIDFILNGKEYRKPPSVFPAVFKADVLRKAGFMNMKIFDTQTYMLAALHGDVKIIADTIGIYRVHRESNTYGRKDNNFNARRLANLTERLNQNRIIRNTLYSLSEKTAVNEWYAYAVLLEMGFFSFQRYGAFDVIKIYKTILNNADINPGLWLKLTIRMLKGILKKITPLRRLYKKIKYGDSHHGEY